MHRFNTPNMYVLERFADLDFEKPSQKGQVKPFSRALYCTSIEGSEQLPLTSQLQIKSSHHVYRFNV